MVKSFFLGAIRFASAKVDSHFMFSVPSKFALWIMKEIGNKIKLKQENNKAPVFFITFKKKGRNKGILKRLYFKKKRRKNNYES